jgi:hypothetical protein
MRLTLRTLLAYRDQVLGSKDAAILEQRLRESQTARTISERISYLLENPIAPPLAVDVKEFGFDPNDVASFLDDAMPADRVTEMERKCLDNPSLLTEVASCHQILAKAIRAPSQASSGLRKRMAGLWKQGDRDRSTQSNVPSFVERRIREDAAHPSVPGPFGMTDGKSGTIIDYDPAIAESGGNRDIVVPSSQHSRREIPAYLQQSERPWIGATLRLILLLALLAVCVSQSLGSWERLKELLDRKSSGWSAQVPIPPAPTER